ncbi:MAG TPA: 3-hydroxyacyl-CoA dehydrogenase family protein [Chitinophagaceae bacterium]|nr:3-hydroxyacyl-CoA dehydrogenase family protein [Chitinophagaceae bacterium]
MHIAVKASDGQKKDILAKGIPAGIYVQWLGSDEPLPGVAADAYFDFLFSNEFMATNDFITTKPVFVNAVACTLKDIGYTNYARINGWSGFFEGKTLEVAAVDNGKTAAEGILNALGWKFVWAPDEPGLIAARVVIMIINEAYFGLADGISTKKEIDIAMKLGTNHPYGPFEWAEKVGLKNIYFLLKKLQQQYGNRYNVAPLLEQEAKTNGIIA